jgi:hypothetical protein
MTIAPFCSRVSQADEGVFPGTGVRGEVYVLLPVNKRFWGASELNTVWASTEELEAIKRARRFGVVTRLYNPANAAQADRILVHPSPAASAASRDMAAQMVGALAAKGWAAEPAARPRLAICTQGTRDRCCAKWGFAVFRQAARLWREGRFPFEPLECSHLGGDRYAATGIVFPSGSMYGHLDHADLEALGAAETEGRILPGHYRGRVYESELAQVVRAGLAKDGHAVGATSPLRILNPEAAPEDVTVTAGEASFRVSLGLVDSDFFGSCKALAQARVSHARRIVYAGAQRLDLTLHPGQG